MNNRDLVSWATHQPGLTFDFKNLESSCVVSLTSSNKVLVRRVMSMKKEPKPFPWILPRMMVRVFRLSWMTSELTGSYSPCTSRSRTIILYFLTCYQGLESISSTGVAPHELKSISTPNLPITRDLDLEAMGFFSTCCHNSQQSTNASVNPTQEPTSVLEGEQSGAWPMGGWGWGGHVKEGGGPGRSSDLGVLGTFTGDKAKWSLKFTDAEGRGGETIFY